MNETAPSAALAGDWIRRSKRWNENGRDPRYLEDPEPPETAAEAARAARNAALPVRTVVRAEVLPAPVVRPKPPVHGDQHDAGDLFEAEARRQPPERFAIFTSGFPAAARRS